MFGWTHVGWGEAVIWVRDLTGHTGPGRLAVVVLVPDGTGGEISIASRMDVALAPDDLPARVYHESAGLPVADAEALVAELERAAERAAQDALAASIGQSGGRIPVLALPVDATETAQLPPLAHVVASHSLMHVAETALYRDAVLGAAEQRGIEVHRYEPATVATSLANATQLSPRSRGRAAGRVATGRRHTVAPSAQGGRTGRVAPLG